jgi:YesN/AraC family two-component response regulator
MSKRFTVVIAEDEELLLNSLSRKIETVDPDFSVIGSAQTGRQAWEMVCSLEPDLLITDICMPVMSGIDLLEKVRERFPLMGCIIISGFSDFEYARSAIQLKISDYLLKPVDPEELKETLAKIKKDFRSHASSAGEIFTPELGHKSSEAIAEELHQYLKEHFTQEINLNEIASSMNYSSSYLTKLFLQQYGTTPSKFILSLRIHTAQNLLTTSPELSVRQIGEAVGYPEQGYFSRIFKKYTGKSPLEYRGETD